MTDIREQISKAIVAMMLVSVMWACEPGPVTTSPPEEPESTPPDEPRSTPVEPGSTPVEPSIEAPEDLSSRTLWMEFGATDVSACSGSIVVCSCNILAPTCTERNRRCERVAKSEHYLGMLSSRYIFDSEALRHPDQYLTRGGPHRVWKYWRYSHSGDSAALSISQPGWWFENGAKWVPMIDLVHRMAFSRRVEGLYPRYEGVLLLQADALQESCSLRISATFELYDN